MKAAYNQWMRKYSVPTKIFLVSRGGLFLLSYFCLIFLPVRSPELWRAFPDNLIVDGWARWDSGWYHAIAQRGYTNVAEHEGVQRDTAFFPLYPLLMFLLGAIVTSPYFAGLIIANVSFFVVLILLYELVGILYDWEVAERTVLLLSVFPFSFYFSAVYSESVFLLTVVAAFYFGYKDNWLAASVFAAASSATRFVGALTIIGLIFLYFERRRFRLRAVRLDALWLPLGFTGIIAFMVYLYTRFGNALQFVESQYVPGWGEGVGIASAWRQIQASWSVPAIISGSYPAMDMLHLTICISAIVIIISTWKRLPLSFALWSILMIFCSFTLWRSMGRFVAVIFPVFIGLALLLNHPQWRLAWLYFSVLFLALLTIMFSLFYWVS